MWGGGGRESGRGEGPPAVSLVPAHAPKAEGRETERGRTFSAFFHSPACFVLFPLPGKAVNGGDIP